MKTRIAADKLFSELDGTHVSVGGSHCTVQVFGVIDEPGRRWVQVALEGDCRTVLTLRLRPNQGPRHAVRELAHWLVDPETTPSVVQHVA